VPSGVAQIKCDWIYGRVAPKFLNGFTNDSLDELDKKGVQRHRNLADGCPYSEVPPLEIDVFFVGLLKSGRSRSLIQ
jgi:hypothetical protein